MFKPMKSIIFSDKIFVSSQFNVLYLLVWKGNCSQSSTASLFLKLRVITTVCRFNLAVRFPSSVSPFESSLLLFRERECDEVWASIPPEAELQCPAGKHIQQHSGRARESLSQSVSEWVSRSLARSLTQSVSLQSVNTASWTQPRVTRLGEVDEDKLKAVLEHSLCLPSGFSGQCSTDYLWLNVASLQFPVHLFHISYVPVSLREFQEAGP